MVKILVFDTETTGLPPFHVFEEKYPPEKRGGRWESFIDYNKRISELQKASKLEKQALDSNPSLWANYLETWPYIVQLSYIFFDTITNKTIVRDVYVNLPPRFTSAEYLSSPDTHPITKTAIEAGAEVSKLSVSCAIEEFMGYFRMAEVVTGHNVDYDVNMLLAECKRTGNEAVFTELVESKTRDKIYCTACKATNLVNICYSYNCTKTPPIFKTPKLNQAYYRMFGYAPIETALHNALIDVVACLRVFYRLWSQGVRWGEFSKDIAVCGIGGLNTNPEITDEKYNDIYFKLVTEMPYNPITQIVNDFTPKDVDGNGIGSPTLVKCELIDNDVLTANMTGKPVEQLKEENEENSRVGRYKKITGLNPFPKKRGGSKRRTNKKRKSNKRTVKRRKKSRRN